jgi:hypothetical protein
MDLRAKPASPLPWNSVARGKPLASGGKEARKLGFAKQATEGLRSRLVNTFGITGLAVALAVGGLAVGPQAVAASGKKVVIVVGPTGSTNSYMKGVADDAAQAARVYTSNVIKVYTPYATWSRVKQVAAGANVLIYVGHGNGWPSPYKPFQTYTKDGLGLNATAGAGSGNNNLKYWGEHYLAADLNLAPNAVVILMRLCYASGNSEMGKAYPTKDVAKQRVDNYGSGFLRTGARAVFAEGLGKSAYIFKALFTSNKTMHEIFWSDPTATFKYRMSFASSRVGWAHGEMDPRWSGSYYRSFIGDSSMTAADWR